MRNTIPAAGEAMPKIAQADGRSAVEDALLDLEGQICDLYSMVQVSNLLFEDLLEKPFMGDKLNFVSSYEMGMVSFACHDLVSRASSLRDNFYAAVHGEDA